MALVLDAATCREMNEIKLKLRALGVNLDNVKWKPEAVYSNPTGFDFTTEGWKSIEQAADKSGKLKQDPTDMPGHDPWRNAKIKSVGWTQLGKPPYVHLDVALSRPGLCRVYIRQHGPALTEHMGVVISAESVYAKDPVVRKVARALALLKVPLEKYRIRVTKIYRKPEPEGFDFDVDDPEGLLKAAASAPALALDDTGQLEGKVAAGVTLGTGYREVGRGPRIHLEIAKNGKGNVHIDLEGWVVGKDSFGRGIYDWVHGFSHHFPEDLLPGYVGRPLVGAWRGVEWRPSVSVEHGRDPDDERPQWRAKVGFVFRF